MKHFFHKHLSYQVPEKLSVWRKISLNAWKPTGDSSIVVFEDIVMDDILAYCERCAVHINTIIVKALSIALQLHPRVNSVIRFGRIYNRKDNGVFVHVLPNTDDDDLSGLVVKNAYSLSLESIDTYIKQEIDKIHVRADAFTIAKSLFAQLPTWLVGGLLHTMSFILYKLNKNSKLFKVPNDPFGSVMLTSVGSLGMQQAACPIAPYTNNSMVVSIGKLRKKAVVIDDQIYIRTIITFGFTFDHRLIDGIHFKRFFESFSTQLQQLTKA